MEREFMVAEWEQFYVTGEWVNTCAGVTHSLFCVGEVSSLRAVSLILVRTEAFL